jgi:hypothetical protein
MSAEKYTHMCYLPPYGYVGQYEFIWHTIPRSSFLLNYQDIYDIIPRSTIVSDDKIGDPVIPTITYNVYLLYGNRVIFR